MTLISGILLFFSMLISALIPGPCVMAIISRSITLGARHGLMVALGTQLADYILICLALTGLSTISSILGQFTIVLQYLGASYLIWLAYRIWRTDIVLSEEIELKADRLTSSLFVGLVTGLANPKAILFYMGFLPAFIELSSIRFHEVVIILLISTFAVGGVLSAYACVGAKVRHLFRDQKTRRMMNRVSSGILASCGVILATKV